MILVRFILLQSFTVEILGVAPDDLFLERQSAGFLAKVSLPATCV